MNIVNNNISKIKKSLHFYDKYNTSNINILFTISLFITVSNTIMYFVNDTNMYYSFWLICQVATFNVNLTKNHNLIKLSYLLFFIISNNLYFSNLSTLFLKSNLDNILLNIIFSYLYYGYFIYNNIKINKHINIIADKSVFVSEVLLEAFDVDEEDLEEEDLEEEDLEEEDLVEEEDLNSEVEQYRTENVRRQFTRYAPEDSDEEDLDSEEDFIEEEEEVEVNQKYNVITVDNVEIYNKQENSPIKKLMLTKLTYNNINNLNLNTHIIYHTVISENNESNINTKCSVCLAQFEDNDELLTLCNNKHFFHKKCLEDWLKVKQHCPNCREDA